MVQKSPKKVRKNVKGPNPEDTRVAHRDDANAAPAKDAEEVELEKLVFGDLDGFREGLNAHEKDDAESSEDERSVVDDAPILDFNVSRTQDLTALQDDELFFVDSGPGQAAARLPTPEHDADTQVQKVVEDADAPAWEDSDDDRLAVSLLSQNRTRKLRETAADDVVTGREYTRRLRVQFERIYPIPEWALPPKPKRRRRDSASSVSSDSDVDGMEVDLPKLSTPSISTLLQTAGGYTAKGRGHKLRPEILDIARLTDANTSAPSVSGIKSLSFHPQHPLLLTAGFDSTMRLYHIDGKTNPAATAMHIKGTPIHTALIHPDGRRVFAGGRRRYFHIWDLESGSVEAVTRIYGHQRDQKSMEHFRLSIGGQYIALVGARGSVQILDATTSQWIASAKAEGQVVDIAWRTDTGGEDILTIVNTFAEVYEYSPRRKAVLQVWNDQGGVACTTIATSPNGRWTAIGSRSGIVSVYDRASAGPKKPPVLVRALENLVTSINVIAFSPDSQLLCIASRGKKDALRMVHLPSVTVYKNWPTGSTPLGRISTVVFAPGKEVGVVAVGNEAGKVRLFEIR